MAGKCHDWVLDNGLADFKASATAIHICSSEPTDYADCLSKSLGNKAFGANNTLTGPAAGSPNGRKVTTVAVTDGAVTGNGTASRWAIIDGSRLLVDNDLASTQVVAAGNIFSLPAFDFRIPGA